MSAYQTVVVGTDGSDSSLRAVDRAGTIAAQSGAKLIVTTAYFPQHDDPRAADMLKEEMESLGPVRIKEVETAQQQIIAMVRQLETEGVVTLKGSTGDQYVL